MYLYNIDIKVIAVSFKKYDQSQLSLLPPSLEELIPAADPVRVVNAVVDRLNLKGIEKSYGSEENYEFAEENHITPFVKYNYFHKEQKRKLREDPFRRENLHYDSERECYFCPMGQRMERVSESREETANGFMQTITRYRAHRCAGCPLRGMCHKAAGERVIAVNHNLERHKARVRGLLTSPEGLAHRSARPAQVEQAFANLKANKAFRRFLCRGLEKVGTEFGLLVIAHNISKMALSKMVLAKV